MIDRAMSTAEPRTPPRDVGPTAAGLSFDGNGEITVPDEGIDELDFLATSFSVSMWVKISPNPDGQMTNVGATGGYQISAGRTCR